MAYIGNSPANVGNYQIVDDISSSFNGSTTSFALASGSITITPAKSGQLLVGVNGVMQEPDDTGTNGFKVSGSNVVFSSAPASGDTFWAVYQGQAVDVGTPSAGTVDTTQLAADAVTGAKIADNAIDSEHYTDGSIDNAHIADDAIDSEHYAAGSIDTAHIADDAVTADKLANSINTDIATGVTAGTTASAALPKAGGAMTGAITTNSTFDGVDIATRDGILTSTTTTAGAALPKAGGTMTGTTSHGDNVKAIFGTGNDLEIYHDGSNSIIKDAGTGNIHILADDFKVMNAAGDENIIFGAEDGTARLFHNNVTKFETTANGVTVTGTAVATTSTAGSQTGSVTLDFATNQNFVLTMTGNVTLANPSTEQVGQSGFITLIQDGTGSRTLAVGDQYFGAGGEVPTISTDANAIDVIPYIVIASGKILLGAAQLAFADAS